MLKRFCAILVLATNGAVLGDQLALVLAQDRANCSDKPAAGHGCAKGRLAYSPPATTPDWPGCPNKDLFLLQLNVGDGKYSVVNSRKIRTDASGRWSAEVPPGKYIPSMVASPQMISTIPLDITAGQVTTFKDFNISVEVCREK
jgi:hypothetical protein